MVRNRISGIETMIFNKNITWQASLWAARASSLAALRDFRWVSTAGIEVLGTIVGRAQGSYPIIR